MLTDLWCLRSWGLVVFLPCLKRIQPDQQWLRINPFSVSPSYDIGWTTSGPPQWLFLHLRTKCTTLPMTWRGMLMCKILTPIRKCTESLWIIQKVGQIHFCYSAMLSVFPSISPVCVFPVCSLISVTMTYTISICSSFLERGCWWVLLEEASNRTNAAV